MEMIIDNLPCFSHPTRPTVERMFQYLPGNIDRRREGVWILQV